jgi:CDP-diacylglycerol--serine O-phosphatidyltransferase
MRRVRKRAERLRRRRLRAQPLLHLVPNILTVMCLCAGLTAIRYGLDQRFELAVALIVLAGVFDALDGRSARLLKITSKIGAQLDSLADFLSFGVAPAVLIYLWSLNQVKAVGWTLALLFATCCALRLARFNIELEEASDRPAWMSRFFTGMPAPAAAGCAILPMLLAFAFDATWPQSWVLNAGVMVVVALMMVSRIPTVSIKTVGFRVKPEWVLPTLIFAGLFAAGLSSVPWLTLLAVGLVYMVSLPVGWVAVYRLRRADARAAAPASTVAVAPDLGGDRDPESDRGGDQVVDLGGARDEARRAASDSR